MLLDTFLSLISNMSLIARGKNVFATFWPLLHVYVLLFWHFLALQKLGTVFENELPIIQKLVRNHLL